MAQLDPSIITSVRPPLLPNLEDMTRLSALATQGQAQRFALSNAQQTAQRAQGAQQTLADLYRANTKADGTVDQNAIAAGMARAGYGEQVPEIQKQGMEAQTAGLHNQGAQIDLHLKKLGVVNNALGALLADPQVSHDKVIGTIGSLVDQGIIDQQQGAQMVRTLPGPDRLRQFLVEKAMETMTAAQQLEATRPKYDEQNRGATINEGTIDPMTGQRTAVRDVAVTATPGQKLAAQTAAARPSFQGQEGDLLAALAEQGVSLPAGMRSKDQQIATLRSLLSRNPGMTPDEIAYKVGTGQIGFGVDKKETTTAAAQSGKIRYAENEIKQIAPLIREASALVPRGTFVPWNKLKQMGESSISDPNLKQLKSYMNTLSNAYDMLAARGGTDQDKRAHNRAMFDAADSPQALEAALQAVEKEAEMSDRAAQLSTTRRGGPPGAAPAPGARPPLDAILGPAK